MFQLQEPYSARPIRFLELWRPADWCFKLYGIAYDRPTPRPEVIASSLRIFASNLATLTAGKPHYHVGFIGIHEGRGSIFSFLDFWADENELHHHVYVAPLAQPDQGQYMTPTGLTACVWDLRILCFERQAWLTSVLANPTGPDLELYLAQHLNEDV